MKNSMINIECRRKKICNLVSENPMSVELLSKKLNVTEMTIRRDCSVLEKMGMVTRKKGIIHIQKKQGDADNPSISIINDTLAKKAASYLTNNHVVFINSSKTAAKVIQYISSNNITIVTNNLNSLHNVPDNVNIILTGGHFFKSLNMLAGEIAYNTFDNFHADCAIIGCDGIMPKEGVFTSNIEGAQLNQVIVKNSQKVILVANYKKIGNLSNLKICDITAIDLLITDTFADKKVITQLEKAGVTVIQLEI